jgi:hypothetical protein
MNGKPAPESRVVGRACEGLGGCTRRREAVAGQGLQDVEGRAPAARLSCLPPTPDSATEQPDPAAGSSR